MHPVSHTVELTKGAPAMCWLCDHPDNTVADYLDEVRAKILRRGWAVQYVESPRMPFA